MPKKRGTQAIEKNSVKNSLLDNSDDDIEFEREIYKNENDNNLAYTGSSQAANDQVNDVSFDISVQLVSQFHWAAPNSLKLSKVPLTLNKIKGYEIINYNLTF